MAGEKENEGEVFPGDGFTGLVDGVEHGGLCCVGILERHHGIALAF